MRLIAFNGSPRGKKSNTSIFIDSFAAGVEAVEGNSAETHYLCQTREHDELVQRFAEADAVLVAFPLYYDAMPGMVKAFIEKLRPLVDREGGCPPIVFMVQCALMEPAHIRPVEQYLEKLARRLNAPYGGTIVKAGAEGTRLFPAWFIRGLRRKLRALGAGFARAGKLDPELLRKLSGPDQLSGFMRFLLRIMPSSAQTSYFDNMLKQHGSMEQRDARPYEGLWPAAPRAAA